MQVLQGNCSVLISVNRRIVERVLILSVAAALNLVLLKFNNEENRSIPLDRAM